MMIPADSASYFDDRFHAMKHGPENGGEWDFCYAQQTELFSGYLKPGMLVLDIGCGPTLPYPKPPGVQIIGLEPSLQSIRNNDQLDLRVFGTAYSIPLADASVDVVTCFYAIHHMVGKTGRETVENVNRAFAEFGRVLKPGGHLFVFEMTPVVFFVAGQRAPLEHLPPDPGAKIGYVFFLRRAVGFDRPEIPSGRVGLGKNILRQFGLFHDFADL